MLALSMLLWGASFLAMIGTLGYQVLLYLRYGGWAPISATSFCADHLDIDWCAYPQDWLGLHSLLSYLSPGGAALIASTILVLVCAGAEERRAGLAR
jgi:hypothetical protein